jgi:CheY-like chemotaxis protein
LTALVAATVGARLWLNTAPNDAAESLEAAPGAAAVVGGPPASARPVFRKVLWVDDKPRNNERERDAMAAFGVDFVLARSTAEAVDLLASNRFDLVVSDLHRPDDPNAGITLLSHMRQRLGDRTPFVLYTRQCSSERAMEVRALGALACTEQISGLMHAALLALESRP